MQASITREPNYAPPTPTEQETFCETLSDLPEGSSSFLSSGQLLRWSLVEPTARNVASKLCATSSRWLRRGRSRSSPLALRPPPPPTFRLSSPRCVFGFGPFAVFPLGSLICPLFPLSNPGDFPSNSPATPPTPLVFWHRGSAYLCL